MSFTNITSRCPLLRWYQSVLLSRGLHLSEIRCFFHAPEFQGNPLYGEVFAKYLKSALERGAPLEFFIEGGRSRTGKMVMPKYGLLSMIIQAYKEGACDDLALIPVYIGYAG